MLWYLGLLIAGCVGAPLYVPAVATLVSLFVELVLLMLPGKVPLSALFTTFFVAHVLIMIATYYVAYGCGRGARAWRSNTFGHSVSSDSAAVDVRDTAIGLGDSYSVSQAQPPT